MYFVIYLSYFRKGVSDVGRRCVDREIHVGDRVTLTIRLLRSGKLSLMRNAEAAADVFMVGKAGSDKLREVWH